MHFVALLRSRSPWRDERRTNACDGFPLLFARYRDDYEASDWATVRDEAARSHNRRTSTYLLGMPLLSDFLEEGLSMLGRSCDDFEKDRL